VGIVMGACAWAAIPQVAEAATTTTTTTPPVAMSFSGTAADGTALTLGARITDVTLGRFSAGAPTASPGGPGSDFLTLDMATDESAGTGPSFNGFDSVPIGDISLALADGTVVPAVSPGPQLGFLEGNYSFVVPAGTTGGTLEVTAMTVSALEYPGAASGGGAFTQVTFQPATASFVVPPPAAAATVPNTTEPNTTEPTIPETDRRSSRTLASPTRQASSPGLTTPQQAGAGAGGGLLVLVLVIPIWRRRAYRKADREGRVIIDSPPVITATRPQASNEAAPHAEQATDESVSAAAGPVTEGAVVIKIVGPLEIDGLVRPITVTSTCEMLVYLALNPGQSFTSRQLRSNIWVEGRTEPTQATFHNYLSQLRRSMPAGTFVRTGYHYALTEAVTSDWARVRSLLERQCDRAESLEAALALVRGTPLEGELSRRNSPYGWAADISHQIEAAVENAGHELATLSLESGDLAQADAAIAQVLKCVPASIVAREDFLRVGAVLGGPREVGRRFAVARHAMGDGADLLEPVARELGWERS